MKLPWKKEKYENSDIHMNDIAVFNKKANTYPLIRIIQPNSRYRSLKWIEAVATVLDHIDGIDVLHTNYTAYGFSHVTVKIHNSRALNKMIDDLWGVCWYRTDDWKDNNDTTSGTEDSGD